MKNLTMDHDRTASTATAELSEQFLAVRRHGHIDLVAISDPLYIEGSDKYAELVLASGELEYRRGNRDHAFELLREAVTRDDGLKYDEPWCWMQPVRHALGQERHHLAHGALDRRRQTRSALPRDVRGRIPLIGHRLVVEVIARTSAFREGAGLAAAPASAPNNCGYMPTTGWSETPLR